MSAGRNIREAVAAAAPRRDGGTSPTSPESPRGSSRAVGFDPGHGKNAREVLDFVAKVASLTSRQPELGVESVLEQLGFEKAVEEELDDDSESMSSSSFSFAMVDGSVAASFASGGGGKTKDGNSLAKFSSELAHRSWLENNRRYDGADDAVSGSQQQQQKRGGRAKMDLEALSAVVPWRGPATIMFVDLSGYSKIAAALTGSGGAHALSQAVNSYFEVILAIVSQFLGDVIVFAGDAVVSIWPSTETRSLQACCLLATSCALELQRKCGMSAVPGTDLVFRLHIGITCGDVESVILTSRSVESMQGAYHYVSGLPLTETASVVDAARSGEVCVTAAVRELCGHYLQCSEVAVEEDVTASSASSSRFDSAVYRLNAVDDDVEDVLRELPPHAKVARSSWIETQLVPPSIAKKLRQGFKASHIAEMRFLCVLFVRKQFASVSTEEWFTEVQPILDAHRCPVVQILHDDKGTHIIAAVNLYNTERNPAAIGILAARALVAREAGCLVGAACGDVFCGIAGSEWTCRWDVTGPACVRACRLMQYGMATGIDAVIDESLFSSTNDVSQLEEIHERIVLKGSARPVVAYKLSPTSITATAGIMANAWASPLLFRDRREQLTSFIKTSGVQRGIVLVTGPVGSGKKTLLTMALEAAGVSFMAHFASRDRRPLTILRTLADWFEKHADPDLSQMAAAAGVALSAGKLTLTLNLAHQLVAGIIKKGLRVSLVICYAQLMDRASAGFIRAILNTPPSTGNGAFFFGLTAYALYGAYPINHMVEELQYCLSENKRISRRSQNSSSADSAPSVQLQLCHVTLSYPTSGEEFAEAFAGIVYYRLRPHAREVLLEATGGCLGLLPSVADIYREEQDRRLAGPEDARSRLMHLTDDGSIHLTPAGVDYFMKEINWPRVAPQATSRFTELYDALPPRLQLVLRVIASGSTTTGTVNQIHVAKIMGKLNPRVKLERILADCEKLIEYMILERVDVDGGEVRFCVPAMVDVVGSLLTPDQDKILKRHAFRLANEFLNNEANEVLDPEHKPILWSFVARLARAANDTSTYQRLLAHSWGLTVDLCASGAFPEVLRRMELRIASECRSHSTIVSPSMFQSYAIKPMLAQLREPWEDDLERMNPMTKAMYDVCAYVPTMALGAIAGEAQKLCWCLLNNWLDLTKEKHIVFLPDNLRPILYVDVDAYGKALEKFETRLPPFPSLPNSMSGPPWLQQEPEWTEIRHDMSINDEKHLIGSLQESVCDSAAAHRKAKLFLSYHYKLLLPRRDRIVAAVRSMTSVESACPEMLKQMTHEKPLDCVATAFRRFLRPYPIPDIAVHEALMDLSAAGWVSRYFHINLPKVRDLIFLQRVATLDDFKAMLFSLKLIGEQITAFPAI
jgi:class 3 adenylate cyclase